MLSKSDFIGIFLISFIYAGALAGLITFSVIIFETLGIILWADYVLVFIVTFLITLIISMLTICLIVGGVIK